MTQRRVAAMAFYVGLPLAFGHLRGAGLSAEAGAELPHVFLFPLRGLVIWLSYVLVAVSVYWLFRPSRRWFLAVAAAGWVIGAPLGHFLLDALSPLATFGQGMSSVDAHSHLFGRPYVGLPIWLAGCGFFFWTLKVPLFGFPEEPAKAPAPPRHSARLLSRLPDSLGTNLIAIQGEGHYLRVHTDRGSDLIHYKLSDAVGELGDSGTLVHRSHWVANDAVAARYQRGQTPILILKNGVEVPISRSFKRSAMEAGLLQSP